MILKIHLENQDEIRKLLQESGKKAEPLLKQAVNETAKQAKKRLYQDTKSEYTIRRGKFSEKSLELKRATLSKSSAQIQISGEVLSLPGAYQFRKNGKRVAAKAAVKRGGMKPIETGGLKGFVASVRQKDQKKEHTGIFQRRTGARHPIREAQGPSISKLTEMTFRRLEGEIGESLQDAVWNLINKTI